MTSAWTCRLRTAPSGQVNMMLIPAAGMGFSEPCCTDGHTTALEAAEHGAAQLVKKLCPMVSTTAA